MSRAPHSHVPYGDMGVGLYGQVLATQNLANVLTVQDKILEAVEKIPTIGKEDSMFTIVEYGCADGASSIPLIGNIIRRVRERASKPVPIQVIYEDQPTNDFTSLFKRIHGLIPEPRTYLKEFSDVYVMASGTEFFQPVMPPETVDLILSFGSAHYLSEPGPKYQDSLHRFPNATAEECKLVEAQAAKDWETFLLQRAKELKKGGVLFVAMPAYDPLGTLGGVKHCVQGIEEAVLEVWRTMRDEGRITQEEFVNTNMHRCPKTLEECRAPFLAGVGGSVRQAGLELCSSDLVNVPCATTAAWRARVDNGEDSREREEEWASAIVERNRVWLNWPFTQALSDDDNGSRSGSGHHHRRKEAVVDKLFARVEQEVRRQGPGEFLHDFLMVYLIARKCA